MNEDLIRRKTLMPLFVEKANTMKDRHGVKLGEPWLLSYDDIKEVIDNAPPADIKPFANVIFDKDELSRLVDEKVVKAIKSGELFVKTEGEWVPIKYRPLTVEQRIAFAEHYGIEYCDTADEKAFDCPMPEDGQEILISTSWGVRLDVATIDIDGDGFICYGLDENGDWDGVDAWMPLPETYKETENE